MRYLLRLSYLGTAYHGWQRQENAKSVQEVIEDKLSLLTGKYTEITGCGRTDTGVHARDYFAHFDAEQIADLNLILHKINQMLPSDISIFELYEVDQNFHARFDASYREYEYHITTRKDPFMRETAWFRYGQPDIVQMNKAAQLLLQHKDFECFSKVHTQVNHFHCDVSIAEWKQEEHKLVFTIRANRFLRNMVRAIVGTLLEVGYKNMTIDEFKSVLNSGSRSLAGQSVPAHGLFLTAVVYAAFDTQHAG